MQSLYTANDTYLFGRLNEIEDSLSDYFISGYKSYILIEERELIKNELKNRGCTTK